MTWDNWRKCEVDQNVDRMNRELLAHNRSKHECTWTEMCEKEETGSYTYWKTTCGAEPDDADVAEITEYYDATHCPWCGGEIVKKSLYEQEEDRRGAEADAAYDIWKDRQMGL